LKIKNISILGSLVCLAVSLLFSDLVVSIIALTLVLSIGILHGANDILLIQKTEFSLTKFKIISKLIYSLVVFLAILFFYFIPFYALIFFVLFSAYHFGEQHWDYYLPKKINNTLKFILQFSYGFFILNLLFLLKSDFTTEIISDISNYKVQPNLFLGLTIASFLIYLGISIYLLIAQMINVRKFWSEIILLALFGIIFHFTPLLLGFAIYFTFWHSLPSLKDQINFIYNSDLKAGIIKYIKDAWWYWLLSVTGLAIFVYFFYETKMFYSLLFTFIAAITFPHVVVMGKMFHFLKNESN
jgi:Brp/Blh family beta-carotene 15,15'-monooxygenase